MAEDSASEQPPMDGWAPPNTLLAFGMSASLATRLEPAERTRDWIHDGRSDARWCLPLLMANQAGWVLLNPIGVSVTWDGGEGTDALTVVSDAPRPAGVAPVVSLFGHGIVSWQIPYLFRTPEGFDLLARGPANSPKDGVSPLEGLIETDWAVMPFTMNWKLTRPGTARWEAGEPFCMLVPQRRADLTAFQPEFRILRSAPVLAAHTERALRERHRLRQRNVVRGLGFDSADDMRDLERQYFRGRYPDGTPAPTHRAQIRLRQLNVPDVDDDGGSATDETG
jgi:hypothetical protein